MAMKVTEKGQVTIPLLMRKKHGLLPHAEIAFVDQPNGVLVTKAAKRTRGKRVLSQLMRGGVVKARTKDWLKMTRGNA
jgi:bifunctional DNA-binding transcriptional regulator/antitoxin component of YhaV-PrlF toxin-antitoxin module